MSSHLAEAANRFRALHQANAALVLPNAWDAASAATLVEAGFGAIATSSGAISRALGYSDGEGTPSGAMFEAIAGIVAAAKRANPRALVTADIEHGYGLPVGELVERLAAAGVVGCNLEDSDPRTREMIAVNDQARWITEVRQAAEYAGTALVINARVDLHVRKDGPDETRLERSLERARAYLAAGADCVFPIMLAGEADLEAYTQGTPGPVNVMVTHATPDPRRLGELGVARVTFGSGLQRIALTALSEAAHRILMGEAP